jgi:hypothetical protein
MHPWSEVALHHALQLHAAGYFGGQAERGDGRDLPPPPRPLEPPPPRWQSAEGGGVSPNTRTYPDERKFVMNINPNPTRKAGRG